MKHSAISDEEKVMSWWNSLTFTHKYEVIIKYKRYITGYPDRSPDTLTRTEIHNLWSFENAK